MTEERARPTRTLRIPLTSDVYMRVPVACPLGPIESQVLARLDGRVTLGDVAALLGLSGRETAIVIARLVELGAAERRGDEVDSGWTDDPAEPPTTPPGPLDPKG